MFHAITNISKKLLVNYTCNYTKYWLILLVWNIIMLTQKQIISLKPKKNAYYVWDDTGSKGVGRLGIKVLTSGAKVFVFRYYRAQKRVFIQLGRFPNLSLSESRTRIAPFGQMLKDGVDPKSELAKERDARDRAEKKEKQQGSVKQLFHSYINQMRKDGKRTYKQVLYALEKEVYPLIPPGTKAKKVTTHDVITVLAAMIKRDAVTQSNRVRSYMMAAFNYGLTHDNDPANYIEEAMFGLTQNPVVGIPKQKSGERVGEHYLSMTEVHQLLYDMRFSFGSFPMGHSIRHLIQLCFFTGGQRPYELAASEWDCINWKEKTWLIPADISKNKKPHLIPLTESAIKILQAQSEMVGSSGYIFPNGRGKGHIRLDSLSTAISRYRDRVDIRGFVARDIRRTCKTLMGELGISKSLRDRIQNHALNDVSSKHYDRYDYLNEKRSALLKWELRLIREGEGKSNVIEIGQVGLSA